jgi:glutamyl-tRNA reductase
MQSMKQQMEQMQQALQAAQQQIETQTVEAMRKMAESDKDRAIDAYKAETERMKVMQPAMGPQEIQALVLQTVQQLLTSPPIPPEPQAPPMQPPMAPPGLPPPDMNQPPPGGFFTP